MRRLHFKPGLQESVRRNQKALDHLQLMAGSDMRIDLGAKEKRERGPVNEADSEAPVLNAVADLLAVHPNVWIAIRMNSGMAYSEGGAPVWFHKMIRGEGVCSDYIGILKTGRPFAIECKRPSWSGVSGGSGKTAIREQGQLDFINTVRQANGVGGFACSVDDALEIIER